MKQIAFLLVVLASSLAQAGTYVRLTCKMDGTVTLNNKVMSSYKGKPEVYSYYRDSIAKDGTNHSIPVLFTQSDYLLFSEDKTYQALPTLEETLKGIELIEGRAMIYSPQTHSLFYISKDGEYLHQKSGTCSVENIPAS